MMKKHQSYHSFHSFFLRLTFAAYLTDVTLALSGDQTTTGSGCYRHLCSVLPTSSQSASSEDLCPPLPENCEPTRAPCYCPCPICRTKLGERCNEQRPICEERLLCLDEKGREKEELYWWNVFHGTCQLKRNRNDASRSVTYILIATSMLIFAGVLLYATFATIRRRRRRLPDRDVISVSGILSQYRSTDSFARPDSLHAFIQWLATKQEERRRPLVEILLQHQREEDRLMSLSEFESENRTVSSARDSQPPPYTAVGQNTYITPVFRPVNPPHYDVLAQLSRPPSYEKINEITL